MSTATETVQNRTDYAHPEVLVSTDWVLEHHADPGVKLVEVDVDTQAYHAGHIPGAVGLDWEKELQDQTRRDIAGKAQLEKLLGERGISRDDTIVLYGDHSNWFAAYAFWLFKTYGHEDVRLMNGGRNKWLDEDDKPLTTDAPQITPTTYAADEPNAGLRAKLGEILALAEGGQGALLVDVRSPDEFTGKVVAPPGLKETAQRAGHIPGAKSVPWATAVAEDGTFKPFPELKKIYVEGESIAPGEPVIAYCRIGERSSHTWFVLKYLLGFENVRNYDGSWTEYGSIVGAPIENPSAAE